MANQEHFDLLFLSTEEEWNRWREENPDVVPDLSGADLSGEELSELNFRDANFHGASFCNAFIGDCDFRGADLEDAKLTGAYISGADFRGAKTSGEDFSHIDPEDAQRIKITLSQAKSLLGQILGIEIFPDEEEKASEESTQEGVSHEQGA